MFMMGKDQYPTTPDQGGNSVGNGNLQDIIPALAQATGALGGMGGGNGFMSGFNSSYNPNQTAKINLSSLLSNALGQSNFAQLNTLGGLVSPISGGMY